MRHAMSPGFPDRYQDLGISIKRGDVRDAGLRLAWSSGLGELGGVGTERACGHADGAHEDGDGAARHAKNKIAGTAESCMPTYLKLTSW